MGRHCLSDEEIKNNIDKKTKGRYEYISDERFPYKNQRSLILVKDNLNDSYKTLTYCYIMNIMKNE